MRVIIIIFLSILAVSCVTTIIGNKINDSNLKYILNLREKIELFKKSITFIESQLRLHNLKDCPPIEKDNIVHDILDFIEEIRVFW